jgi:hypothetical protein
MLVIEVGGIASTGTLSIGSSRAGSNPAHRVILPCEYFESGCCCSLYACMAVMAERLRRLTRNLVRFALVAFNHAHCSPDSSSSITRACAEEALTAWCRISWDPELSTLPGCSTFLGDCWTLKWTAVITWRLTREPHLA